MKKRVKNYVENCIEMARFSIKIHKKFLSYNDDFWLKDAEKYTEAASLAIEYNMLPNELKNKDLLGWKKACGSMYK